MTNWITLLAAISVLVSARVCSANSLEDLPNTISDYTAARVSSTDTTGGNKDFLSAIQPGETRVLADIKGPGMITHIWCTIAAERWVGRKIVLRMYWDGEKDPSVLAPIGDFFCQGHGKDANVRSVPITCTAGGRARNCFFRMPFNKSARIEVTNEGLEQIGAFYYYVDYRKYAHPHKDTAYFHAHYRQEYPAVSGKDYLVCSLKGKGHFVGAVLSYEQHTDGWYGEGDDKFYIDGETSPSMIGTGTEDYLCDAWGTWPGSSPYYGTPIHEGTNYKTGARYTSYRFHIADPIPFQESLRFEIEHYGAGVVSGRIDGFVERADNLSSMAYWYQVEPHDALPPLPSVGDRLPDEAAFQKRLLNFLSRARKPAKEAMPDLRKEFAELYRSQEFAPNRTLFRTVMAHAELRADERARVAETLRDSITPFVNRSLLRDPELKAFSPKISSTTPILLGWDDGSDIVSPLGDKPAAVTDLKAGKGYLYFTLPEMSELKNKQQNLRLRISYYSDGKTSGTFTVQYNGRHSDSKADAYRNAETTVESPEPGWHRVEVPLPDAYLTGSQNGAADFRIAANDDGDVAVSELEFIPLER